MKKTLLFSAFSLAVLAMGCSSDEERFGAEGIGRVILSPQIKSNVTVASRAVDGEDYLLETLKLWVSNEQGPIRKYTGASSIPDKEWLPSGKYLAEAWAGDSVSATFDPKQRWFKGASHFSISALQTTEVTIPCKIANVLVEVVFDSYILDNLKDINLTVGHSRGKLEYTPDALQTGYFMMPSTDKDLSWTLTATRVNDGVAVKKSGTIKGAKSAYLYTLVAHANVDDDEIGGAFFGIKVDTTVEPVTDYFVIELPPVIEGIGFNPKDGVVFKEGEIGEPAIFIIASADIVSAKLTLDGLSEYLGGVTDLQGNPFNTIDLMQLSDDMKEKVNEGGIEWVYNFDDEHQAATLEVIYREVFTDRMKEGEYEFIHEITDSANPPRTTYQTVHVRVSNDILNLEEPVPYDVWPTKATVSAVAMQDDCGTVGFEYRAKGSSNWISAAAVQSEKDGKAAFSAQLTALVPGTTYEYRVVSDKDNFASKELEFTTEAPLQLPNANFESWQQPSKPWLPYGAGEAQFWDSGNHGSTTISATSNICVPAEDLFHSGSKSAHLVSRFVGIAVAGKLAAGNIFAGEYLATDGTDGVLGWGRPFASRPTALKGYIKYKSGKINQGKPENIPGNPVVKGDNDQGIIYVAILDNSISKTYVGKSYPVIIKTKSADRALFSSSDPNVLGYGEHVWSVDTQGVGMIEFNIPINYDGRPHNVPAYIVLTCSASRYGDYFVGSDSSEMWLDDLELVYE